MAHQITTQATSNASSVVSNQTATHTSEDVQSNKDLLFDVSNVNIDSPLSDASYCASIAEQQANEQEEQEAKEFKEELIDDHIDTIERHCACIMDKIKRKYFSASDCAENVQLITKRLSELDNALNGGSQ